MAGGSFYGGLASGAMATWKMLQDEERMSMERDRQERANKVADMQIKNLEDQEAARTQVGDITRQEAGDAALAATPAAQRQANYDAALAANQTAVASGEGEALTDTQKSDVAKAYGVGLASDDVRRYQYGLKRAQVFEAAGDIARAKAYRDEAQDQAAAAWMQGILGKDSARVKDLYNLYPNGHNVSNVGFDDKGNVLITDDKGQRTMDKYDAVAQGLAVMKPETAAKFIETQLQAKDRDEIKRYLGELSTRIAQQNADTRVASVLGRTGGAGSAGTRGTGSGTAAPAGKPAPEGLYGIPGVKDQKAFDDMVDPFAPKDAAPALMGPDGKTPVQVSPTDYRSAFSQNLINLATGNPNIEPGNLRSVAKAITDDGLTKGGKVTQEALLRPDGHVVLAANVNGRVYQLGKNDLNESEIASFFDMKKPEQELAFRKLKAQRDAIVADSEQKGMERVWRDPALHKLEINRLMKEADAEGRPITAEQAESEFTSHLEDAKTTAASKRKDSGAIGLYRDEAAMSKQARAIGMTQPTKETSTTDRSVTDQQLLETKNQLGKTPVGLDISGGLKRVAEWATRGSAEAHLSDLRAKLRSGVPIEPAWAGVYLNAAKSATPQQRTQYGITDEMIRALELRSKLTPSDIRAEEGAAAAASAAARTQTGLIR